MGLAWEYTTILFVYYTVINEMKSKKEVSANSGVLLLNTRNQI